jgi:hypothetical protein
LSLENTPRPKTIPCILHQPLVDVEPIDFAVFG